MLKAESAYHCLKLALSLITATWSGAATPPAHPTTCGLAAPELQVLTPAAPAKTPVPSQSVKMQAHLLLAPSFGLPSVSKVAAASPEQGLVASTGGQVPLAACVSRLEPLAFGMQIALLPSGPFAP